MQFFGTKRRRPDSRIKPSSTTSPDLAAAAFALELQYRHIDRAAITAQSFLGALTLSAALAGPLLVIGVRRSLPYGFFGLLLIGYLAVLGIAIRHCIRSTYRRFPTSESFENLLHYIYIASRFASPAEYSDVAVKQQSEQRVRELYEYVWLTAIVMAERRRDIHKAIRWTMASLLLLGCLVVFRFVIAFVFE
jgi:hypothetical protein